MIVSLPPEILELVLKHLSLKDTLSLSFSNEEHHTDISNSTLWSYLAKRNRYPEREGEYTLQSYCNIYNQYNLLKEESEFLLSHKQDILDLPTSRPYLARLTSSFNMIKRIQNSQKKGLNYKLLEKTVAAINRCLIQSQTPDKEVAEIEFNYLTRFPAKWIDKYIKTFPQNDLNQNLTALNFGKCFLQTLPKNIDKLSKLKFINLEHNRITLLPNSLINLKNLTEFHCGGSHYKEILSLLVQIPTLKRITLEKMGITKIPGTLKNLSALERLNLYDNPITSISNDLLTLDNPFENLTYFYCGGGNLPDILSFLSSMSSLEYISVCDMGIKEIPKSISQLTNLRELYVLDNSIKSLPKELGELPHLNCLPTEGNLLPFKVIPNKPIDFLFAHSKIKNQHFARPNVDNAEIEELSDRLERLKL